MNGQTRTIRRLTFIAIAAALAAPTFAAGGTGNPTVRNDVAHFGASTPSERSSAILRNDTAHFGTDEAPSSSNPWRPAAPIIVQVDQGFDWSSAAVGAVGGLGLLLVAGAAASTLRRRQSGNAAPA
jgi:hypothetical protein